MGESSFLTTGGTINKDGYATKLRNRKRSQDAKEKLYALRGPQPTEPSVKGNGERQNYINVVKRSAKKTMFHRSQRRVSTGEGGVFGLHKKKKRWEMREHAMSGWAPDQPNKNTSKESLGSPGREAQKKKDQNQQDDRMPHRGGCKGNGSISVKKKKKRREGKRERGPASLNRQFVISKRQKRWDGRQGFRPKGRNVKYRKGRTDATQGEHRTPKSKRHVLTRNRKQKTTACRQRLRGSKNGGQRDPPLPQKSVNVGAFTKNRKSLLISNCKKNDLTLGRGFELPRMKKEKKLHWATTETKSS